ncbi:NACHT domain-containing protein, partial [Streptomyces sp. NPDC005070]
MEVHFLPGCGVADGERAEIEWVLSRIAVGDGPGRLPRPVHRVEVVGLIAGGRSGAQVLEIRVRRGIPDVTEWHVAKLQDAAAARGEWQAYQKHMATLETAYRTSVSAVSETVLGSDVPLPGDREAVVYQHVSERIGEPGRSLTTLEQLAVQALDGSHEALRSAETVVGRLLRQLGGTLYRAAEPDRRISLRWLNPVLGPDLLVETADPAVRTTRVYPADLLAASCAPDEAGHDQRLRPGAWIAVEVSSVRGEDGVLLAHTSPDTRIEILPGPASPLPQDGMSSGPGLPDGGRLLYATVLATRTQRYAQLCRDLLGDALELNGTEVRLDGCRFGHPFGRLHAILCDPAEGWVSASVHGDLNPRNVLVADDQPYLIDHARAEDLQPQMGDPAWLELNLLRGVVARRLGWEELIRLQRVLAVSCRLRPEADPRDAALPGAWPLDGEPEHFVAAFRLLWQVRSAARAIYPDQGRRPWWREYLAQLTLAACRTLKWPAEAHDPITAGAALVAAGVAGECLTDNTAPQAGGFFTHWSAAGLGRLAAWLLPRLDPAERDERALLVELVSALGAANPATGHRLTASLEQARDRAVRALCGEAVEQRLRTLRPGRLPYIPLRASTGSGTRQDDALRLLADEPAVVLVGSAGAGKSTVLRELEYGYLRAVSGEATEQHLAVRMPVLLAATDVARTWRPAVRHEDLLADACPGAGRLDPDDFRALLALDGIQVLVDGLDEVPGQARTTVSQWLEQLRTDHPGVRLVVCHRTSAYHAAPAQILRLPTVVLHPVTPEQAHHYTGGRLAGHLFGTEAEDGSGVPPALGRLMGTPLFLWMAVEAQMSLDPPPRSVGELFTAFTTWYLTERHHEEHDSANDHTRYSLDDKVPLLEAVAEHLTENGNLARAPLGLLGPRLERLRPDWRAVLDEVIASELLVEEHQAVGFFHELFRSYFAARTLVRLAEGDPSGLLRRALRFEWQEAARMLVGFPETDQGSVTRLLDTAASADPRYGAWLLRHTLAAAPDKLQAFVVRQENVLAAASAGATAWQRAATALAVLRRPAAWSALSDIAARAGHPVDARVAALRALTDPLSRDVAAARRIAEREPADLAALRRAVDAILGATEGAPTDLEIVALRAIGRAGLTSLSGFAGERIHAEEPWPLVREASSALATLEIDLTPRQRSHREAACRRRLRAADAQAQATSITAKSSDLIRERAELLAVLAQSRDPSALDVLLKHRFVPGLVELPDWSGLLHGPARARLDATPDDPAATLLLNDGDVRHTALQVFADGDELPALAAAHRVLSDPAGPPWDLLERVSPEAVQRGCGRQQPPAGRLG